jgi:GH24 family phage-related lysozyme (muramidase)
LAKDYEGIAAKIKEMSRLWTGKGLDGLIARRYNEAALCIA